MVDVAVAGVFEEMTTTTTMMKMKIHYMNWIG
jgi:hypothetical protein